MKKMFILIIMGLVTAGFLSAQTKGSTMYVAVKKVDLKSSSGFFSGKNGKTLNYADKVTILSVSGKNVEVQSTTNSSISGWTAYANLSAKQIVSGNTGTTNPNDVAMAGKGFNEDVERQYKEDGNYDYDDVDKIEGTSVSEDVIKQFLLDGRLSPFLTGVAGGNE